MSWGYWGIVAGLLVLLTVFFFCIDLLYDSQRKLTGAGKTDTGTGARADSASDTKHAA
ncbi:MAG: hypothetical protein ACREJU_12300 [Nitrospiraceae bacterium]